MKKSDIYALLIFLTILGGTTLWSIAAGPGEPSALVPYHGVLELNGTRIEGSADLRIGLFTSVNDDASCLETSTSGCGAWADEFAFTPVAQGHFSISLGSNKPLPASTFDSDTLYIGVAAGEGGNYRLLGTLQRLSSVPYAVRGERAVNFNVANNLDVGANLYVEGDTDVVGALDVQQGTTIGGSLGVGTDTPATKLHVESGKFRVRNDDNDPNSSIAQFHAADLSQGVGIGYDSVHTLGSNANQSIRLVPRGSGVVKIEGRAMVYNRRNEGGTVSTYTSELGKYVAVANNVPTGGNFRSYTEIPDDVMLNYCGDEDGCTVTVRMRNWAGGVASRTAVSVQFSMHYGELVNGQRTWRRQRHAVSDTYIKWGPEAAVDNNGVINHIVQNHDCYFTDGFYGLSGNNDANRGFGILNWDAFGYAPSCEVILED